MTIIYEIKVSMIMLKHQCNDLYGHMSVSFCYFIDFLIIILILIFYLKML